MKKILYINLMQYGHSANHKDICDYLSEFFNVNYLTFDLGLKKINEKKINVNYVNYYKRIKIVNFFNFFLKAIKLSFNLKSDYVVVVTSSKLINIIFLGILSPFIVFKQKKYLDIRTVSVDSNFYIRKIENKFIKFLSLFFNRSIVFNQHIGSFLRLNSKKLLIVPLGGRPFIELEEKDHTENLNFIYVGAYINRNIDVVVKAFDKFLNDYNIKNSKLILIGYGDKECSKLKKLVNLLGISNFVNVFNRMTHSEIKVFIKSSLIGISYVPINSYYNQQPPTKIIEYGLSGLFTIATNTEASKFLVNDYNGILCDDSVLGLKNALFQAYKSKHTINPLQIKKSFEKYEIKNIVHNQMINKIFLK